MNYQVDLSHFTEKNIYALGEDFSGKSPTGDEISFTNYYMQKNGEPFFGVSGEFHFSRCEEFRWEDEIIKMKMGGINVIATYVFWIHHEETEGVFDFSGRKNLKKFVELCRKHQMYVIMRVGPFDHGEVRNGGVPDWMYGKPFDVRSLNEGWIYYTRRLYTRIAKEVAGLFFKDGGPIIGVQIDNEYMHSSAPWEITTGISNEWVFGGSEGDDYMLRLKELAAECGIHPVFYTCTGWGGAATPDSMLPLWGGYAFRPWLFYNYKGKHPSTEEYIYQDFHNNDIASSNDFQPKYQPEEKPYACCEMGGGMMCSYYYRFILPYKSVDAMANIKLASGCNFLGYYVFQGGNNPVGNSGIFMNEGQVPKISYDYQAALGEFGQVRESYQRLKAIHYFTEQFGKTLCALKTVLPDGASEIEPRDLNTLRHAVRTDGRSGYVFINNFQDHEETPAKENETIVLTLKDETICFPALSIAGDENCILPFHMDMDGMELVVATAQPITRIEHGGEVTYAFLQPDGMKAEFQFADGVFVNESGGKEYSTVMKELEDGLSYDTFLVSKGEQHIHVLLVNREFSNRMYLYRKEGLIFTKGACILDEECIRLEVTEHENRVYTYPLDLLAGKRAENAEWIRSDAAGNPDFGIYAMKCQSVHIEPLVREVGQNRYTILFPPKFKNGIKDAILRIRYRGDIGHAFIGGKMIHDHFCNGDVWDIGLRGFAKELENEPMTIYITPLKKGVNVNVESAMAARIEEAQEYIGVIDAVEVTPVYEVYIK